MSGLVIRRLGCRAIRRVGALLIVLGFPPAMFAQATYTLVHRFKSGARIPIGRLAEAPDGSLYGTTYSGGEPDGNFNGGTIFALRPLADGNRSFETVHQFRPGQDGGNPIGGLILGSDGNFYGLATTGGRPRTETSAGTVFRMSPSGSFTTLHVSLNGDDPMWRLVEASDGNFYGATCHGRYNDTSTIFRITPAGALTTLHEFHNYDPPSNRFNPIEGFCPITELVEGGDGFLYGDAAAGVVCLYLCERS